MNALEKAYRRVSRCSVPAIEKPDLSKSCSTKERDAVPGAQLLDELPARRDAHSLCGHDREVVALGELHGLEQGHEPLFLDEQHRAVAMRGPSVGKCSSDNSKSSSGSLNPRTFARYSRTCSVPRAISSPVCGSWKWPRASYTTFQCLAVLDVVGQELLREILVEVAYRERGRQSAGCRAARRT